VQLVMLVYRLFGGSVNQGLPGLGGNMFDYHGPRGLKVRCSTVQCSSVQCGVAGTQLRASAQRRLIAVRGGSH
jgi:hypothetical protein